MKAVRNLALFSITIWLFLAYPGNVRAEDIPERAYISELVGYAQRFTLSCESRSAVDWASYWGVGIREKKFLNSLPRSDNPDTGFVGNPNDEWGNLPPFSYGVHAEPVAATLREYGLQAEAYRGLSWDDLRREIAAGRPVIVWVIGQMWPGAPVRYTASDGRSVSVARYEHTMILIGYDPSRVHVIDAFSGQTQSYPLGTFLASWKTLGRMAVIGTGSAAPDFAPAPSPESDTPDMQPAVEYSAYSFLPQVFQAPHLVLAAAPSEDTQRTYTVKRGEYLREISRRFNLDWQQIAYLNGIGYPYVIYPGQVLRLR